MSYTLTALPDVDDDFDKLSEPEYSRIKSTLLRLADTPRPAGAIKLTELGGAYRIRVGNYRIVYRVQDAKLIVLVIAVARRDKVYPLAKRRLK